MTQVFCDFCGALGEPHHKRHDCVTAGAVTRVELIDHRHGAPQVGRVFHSMGAKVALAYQDNGRTLKIFISDSGAALPAPEPPRNVLGKLAALYAEQYAARTRGLPERSAHEIGLYAVYLYGRGVVERTDGENSEVHQEAQPGEARPTGLRLPTPLDGRGIVGALQDLQAVGRGVRDPSPPEPSDEQLLAAFIAGCNAENELNEAELSPQNVRKGVAAAIRAALLAGAK